jgi:N-acetylglucosaminyldiphosphoundecaprenol N-acetyl-beta-D-mannosaminyltransferase
VTIIDFAGINIDNLNFEEALQKVKNFFSQNGQFLIVTPNPEMIVACQKDDQFKKIINSADLRLPDGVSMLVISRLLGCPLKERITGIDFLYKLCELAKDTGWRIFLLGSTDGVVKNAKENLEKSYPGMKIVGVHHGFFAKNEEKEIVTQIKDLKVDILFAGLGARKQEEFLAGNMKDLGIKVGMGVGGSFDVISGKKKRAPKWVQKLYIEWLYRLVTEPKRWKRQLALLKFLWLMFLKRS